MATPVDEIISNLDEDRFEYGSRRGDGPTELIYSARLVFNNEEFLGGGLSKSAAQREVTEKLRSYLGRLIEDEKRRREQELVEKRVIEDKKAIDKLFSEVIPEDYPNYDFKQRSKQAIK